MDILWLDTESFGEKDIRTWGTYRFALEGELLLVSYALDDEPVKLWEVTTGDPPPDQLVNAFEDRRVQKRAHNAMYDRNVFEGHGWGSHREEWFCTMVQCYMAGLSGSLDKACTAMGMDEEESKMKERKKLIQMFCKPAPSNHKAYRYDRNNRPEQWEKFCRYAVRDTEAMRRLSKLVPNYSYHGFEYELWCLDQQINDRGLPIDAGLVECILETVEAEIDRLNKELCQLTYGEVSSANCVSALRGWVTEQGVTLPSLQKADVTAALAGGVPDNVRRALAIRQMVGKASTKKYQSIYSAMDGDNRLRGTVQFYGASRTGRFAGRRIQPQNLPRPRLKPRQIPAVINCLHNGTADLLLDDTMSTSSDLIRSVINAPPGRKLVASDLSNIEGRVLAWLAGEEWKLDVFRAFDKGEGPDAYKASYAKSVGISPEQVTDDQRQIGKVQELALGYEGGSGAFASMASGYNLDLSSVVDTIMPGAEEHELLSARYVREQYPVTGMKEEHQIATDIIKQRWRKAHRATKSFWGDLRETAAACVNSPTKRYKIGGLALGMRGKNMLIRLPSGRFLVYCFAEPSSDGRSITYMGMDQTTKQWVEQHTHGGKLAENITQAVARDVLVWHMGDMEREGYQIVLHVHDEVVAECPDSSQFTVAELSGLLATNPLWAPGLPLAADGWEGERYRK